MKFIKSIRSIKSVKSRVSFGLCFIGSNAAVDKAPRRGL